MSRRVRIEKPVQRLRTCSSVKGTDSISRDLNFPWKISVSFWWDVIGKNILLKTHFTTNISRILSVTYHWLVISDFCKIRQKGLFVWLIWLYFSWIAFYPQSITDNGIKALAFCCRFVIHLNLAGCSQITDMGIQYLSGVCQYLRFLNLSGCVLLSSASLVYLKKGCKLLEHLILLYCKGIKSRDIGHHTLHISGVEFNSKDLPEGYLPRSITDPVGSWVTHLLLVN